MAPSSLLLGILFLSLDVVFSVRFRPEQMETCRAQTGYSGNFPNAYMDTNISQDGKCFLACLLEQQNMMVNGVIDQASATAIINNMNGGNEEKKQRYLTILNQCLAEVAPNADKCEYAFQFTRCKQSKSMGK